jgi:uncharacterized protein YbaP (TraB family)
MMKHWLCAALLTAFVGVAYADDKPPRPVAVQTPAAQQSTAPTPVRPALFVARDADSAIYLFGTEHIRRPGSDWGGPVAQAALAEAGEIWTEMEISQATQSEVQALVLTNGIAPIDRPLSSWLNKSERDQLNAALTRFGASPDVFERMQPWLAAMTLSVLPMLQAGYDSEAGVDRAVTAAAGDAHPRAFETAAQQIGFFADLSDAAQRQYLLDTITTANEDAAALDALSDAWATGDLAALERDVLGDFRTRYPELYQILFAQRNLSWTETLMQELNGSGVDFVAVGAGHMLGDDGLVALLSARGVSVERVE